MDREQRGFLYGVGAYASWGVFPLYWKLVADVPVLQVISHRIVWSALMLAVFVAASGQAGELRAALLRPGVLATYATASLLIAVNWFGFIWAVGAGFIVETSLGYFINPLLSVLLAVFVLGESLRALQWVAVALAGAGVLYVALSHGQVPWISLLLAGTFALYGLVKKRAPLGSVQGLTIETGLLAFPAAALLLWSEQAGHAAFLHRAGLTDALLLGAGAVTVVPLLMFASAAQRIPLLWVGLLQYIAPTLQLAIGVLIYGEPFGHDRWIGFSLVWAALLLLAVEGVAAHRASMVIPLPE
ncbi:MAG: EamA family transporter RarD [Candidatus Binatia bacterium]